MSLCLRFTEKVNDKRLGCGVWESTCLAYTKPVPILSSEHALDKCYPEAALDPGSFKSSSTMVTLEGSKPDSGKYRHSFGDCSLSCGPWLPAAYPRNKAAIFRMATSCGGKNILRGGRMPARLPEIGQTVCCCSSSVPLVVVIFRCQNSENPELTALPSAHAAL